MYFYNAKNNHSSNLKVLIEAATVFIGEHQQDNPQFLSNWHLVRLTEQPLLTHHKELFISGFLTPPLLQHINSLFESSDMKDKYLQPVLLRFISRFGRFLIVRFGSQHAQLSYTRIFTRHFFLIDPVTAL